MWEAPSTGLGTKQEQVIEKCSMSSFPSPASILPLSSKVGVALRVVRVVAPHPPQPPSRNAHTYDHAHKCVQHTRIQACVWSHTY